MLLDDERIKAISDERNSDSMTPCSEQNFVLLGPVPPERKRFGSRARRFMRNLTRRVRRVFNRTVNRILPNQERQEPVFDHSSNVLLKHSKNISSHQPCSCPFHNQSTSLSQLHRPAEFPVNFGIKQHETLKEVNDQSNTEDNFSFNITNNANTPDYVNC